MSPTRAEILYVPFYTAKKLHGSLDFQGRKIELSRKYSALKPVFFNSESSQSYHMDLIPALLLGTSRSSKS